MVGSQYCTDCLTGGRDRECEEIRKVHELQLDDSTLSLSHTLTKMFVRWVVFALTIRAAIKCLGFRVCVTAH